MDDNFVRYGDFVALTSQEFEGAVASFGFLDSGCFLQQVQDGDLRHVLNSRSMVFQILPKLNYENAAELRKLSKVRQSKDSSVLELLEHLRQKVKSEKDLNARTVEQRSGNFVYYGQEIQLRHAASGMYLAGSHETAEGDRSCFSANLSDHISAGAHFHLSSRYKFRQEGDPAMYRDVVMLTCCKLDLYLHISDKEISPEKQVLPKLANQTLCPDMAPSASVFAVRFEVNISAQKSTFQFEPVADSGGAGYLRGGAVIRLVHTELAGMVCSEGLDYTKDGLADVYVRRYKGEDALEEVSAHTLFMLEQNDREQVGKTCTWTTGDQPTEYRLRHFTTRRVVCVSKDQEAEILSLAPHPHEVDTADLESTDSLYYMLPTAVEQNNQMRDACVVKIKSKSAGNFVSTTSEEWALTGHDLPALLHQESNRHESDFFMPLEIDELTVARKKIILSPSNALEDAYQLVSVSAAEAEEVEYAMSAISALQRISVQFEMGQEPTRGAYQKIEHVLGKLILYCNDSEDRNPYTCEGAPLPRRQKFLRELGVLDLVCHLLHFPFVGGKHQLGNLGKEDPLTKICTLGYRLVRLAAKDNRANELYCAQWMGLFLSHSEMTTQNSSLHPEEALTEILSDNRRLLERHIHPKMVEKFVNLIRRSRDEKYAKLVTTLCTCDGQAITRNQNTICDLLGSEEGLLEHIMMRIRLQGKTIDVELAESSAWVQLDELAKIAQEGEAENLYDYLLALLDLISNLALSRNHQTDAFRNFYSLDTCFACASSDTLNSLVRSKFVHMLLYLHIDQGDVQPLALPEYTRVWDELSLDFPCSKATLPPAIELAKDFVGQFLQTIDDVNNDPERYQLEQEVLLLAHFLVRCGVYTSANELQKLIPALVRILEQDSQDAAVMKCKKVVCSILAMVVTIQLDYQLSLALIKLKETRFVWGEDITPLVSKRQDSEEEHFSHMSAQASHQQIDDPDDLSLENDPITTIVSLIEQTAVTKFLDISENSGTDLFMILLQLMLSSESALVRESFGLLLQHFTKRQVLTSCLQQVQLLEGEKAVKSYRKIKKLASELCTAAENAEIWLGRDIDASASAAAFASAATVSETHEKVNSILQHFTELCSKTSEPRQSTPARRMSTHRRVSITETSALFAAAQDLQAPINIASDSEDELAIRLFGASEFPDKENQRLLRNLQVYQPALEIAAHKGMITRYNEERHKMVLRHCYIFLAKFCHRNPQNQELVYAHLERCLEDLNRDVCAGLLVQEVFRDNSDLCTRVPAKYIRMIVKQIDSTPQSLAKIALFRVLGVLVKSGERVFKANQLEIATQLASPDLLNILLVYNTNEDFDRLQRSVRECVAVYGGQPPVVKQKEVQVPLDACYLIELFDVLSTCAEDWNAQAELICQRVLTLPQLDRLLEASEQFWPLRNVLILFFLHVYIDVEFAMHDNEKMLWALLDRINTDLKYIFHNYTKQGSTYVADIETTFFVLGNRRVTIKDMALHYVYRALVPTLTEIFMKRGAGLPIESNLELITSVLRLLQAFHKMAVLPAHLETTSKLISVLLDLDKFRKFIDDEDVTRKRSLSRRVDISTTIAQSREMWKSGQLTRIMRSVVQTHQFASAVDKEFRSMVLLMRDVDKTSKITPNQLFSSFIDLLQEEIGKHSPDTALVGLKVLRLSIESHNPDLTTPAAEWDTSDWIRYQASISMSQNLLAQLGAPSLVLAMFTATRSKEVRGECVLLMIAMLLGGNAVAQQEFLRQLQADTSNRFLLALRHLLMKQFDSMRRTMQTQIQDREKQLREHTRVMRESEESDISLNDGIEASWVNENLDVQVQTVSQDHLHPIDMTKNMLRFLQLLCEGHNLQTQDYLREQRVQGVLNSRSTNLVAAIGMLLGPFTKVLHRDNIVVGFQLLDSLTEMVQGPCRGTQAELSQAKIIDNCRDMLICLRYLPDRKIRNLDGDEGMELISELKSKTANFLLSLLEGEYDQEITDRISASLDFRRIKERMADVFATFIEDLGLDRHTATLRKITESLRRDSFEGHIDEGFNLFILMNKLAENNEQARRELPNKASTKMEQLAFNFFKGHTGRIEVVVNRTLQRVYFPILPVCKHISAASKADLLDTVERDTPTSKIFGLLNRSTALIEEMEHNEVLSRSKLGLDMGMFTFLRNLAAALAFIINLIVLFYYDFTRDDTHHIDSSASTSIRLCGLLLVVLYGLILVMWLLLQGSVHVKGKWRERVERTSRLSPAPAVISQQYVKSLTAGGSLRVLLARGPEAAEFHIDGRRSFLHPSTALVYYLVCAKMLSSALTFRLLVVCTLFAGLGQYDLIFYVFLLFDIVFRSATLMGIVNAIVNNKLQLLMTLMLAVIVIFIYAIWGFYITPWMYWQSGFNTAGWGESLCQDLWQCFLTSLDNGPRLSGGIGDLLIKFPFDDKHRWYSRFFLDSSYFFAIRLMFLSIITGIIIDSFAQMRERKKFTDADKKTKCFICSNDRVVLDRLGNGYEKHCAEDHNVWHYVYFLVHLKYKDPTELTGVESHCANKIAVNDISWVPVLRAMCLKDDAKTREKEDLEVEEACKRLQVLIAQVKDLRKKLNN